MAVNQDTWPKFSAMHCMTNEDQHLFHQMFSTWPCSLCSPTASYLPKPGCQEYEFVYVDAKGEVCCCSSRFTFCFPKPLEELVTLEEEQQEGEEEVTDMLLVVPRAELLQVSKPSIYTTLLYNAFVIAAAAAASPLFCHIPESTPGMPARARRAAAVAGSCHQAEGEGKSGVQKSPRGLGQRLQGAEERHQQAAGGAAAEPGEDGGDGEDAEGSVRRKARSWGNLRG